MSAAGTWDLVIATPIGRQAVTLDLTIDTDTAVVRGTATGASESVPLIDPMLTGDRLTWRQSITRPIRLNLTFDVTIDGDTLTGTSCAGRLPTSTVTGTRRL